MGSSFGRRGCGSYCVTSYRMKVGHHEHVHRPRLTRLAAITTAAAAAVVASGVAMLPAHAACNNVVTYQFDPSTGVALSPSTLTVANGACVTFHNAPSPSAQ